MRIPGTTRMSDDGVVRKLSWYRLGLGLVILAVVVGAGTFGITQYRIQASPVASGSKKAWFAGYVDVTAKPSFAFESLGASPTKDVILSFVVSNPADGCSPSWGSVYNMDQASGSLDLERRIARLQQQGGSVAVSFGGAKNQELSQACTDPAKLEAAYSAVLDRYNISTIDLDIEKADLGDAAAAERRAAAIASLQKQRRAGGKNLAVWLTLPVVPQGLSNDGANQVSTMLKGKVDLAGVNVMTMDYGQTLTGGLNMLTASEGAMTETHRQLGVLYDQAGTHLGSATLWSKLGATPMIGQNDDAKEVFTTDDAKAFDAFAKSHGMWRMSMWSANRDVSCGSNYVDVTIVSTSCSGVRQDKEEFATNLSNGFDGSLALSAGLTTKAEAQTTQTPDDPGTSPYQIWSANGAYLEGTKVVWHHNVYQAKYWTQGDIPDDPVLQEWQTPWQLIGPVLPGEKPIPQPTVPPGTYPDWSGSAKYNVGQRVLFNGAPYQAKWWNTGESPAAASSNADGSPWAPLTVDQIEALGLNSSPSPRPSN